MCSGDRGRMGLQNVNVELNFAAGCRLALSRKVVMWSWWPPPCWIEGGLDSGRGRVGLQIRSLENRGCLVLAPALCFWQPG